MYFRPLGHYRFYTSAARCREALQGKHDVQRAQNDRSPCQRHYVVQQQAARYRLLSWVWNHAGVECRCALPDRETNLFRRAFNRLAVSDCVDMAVGWANDLQSWNCWNLCIEDLYRDEATTVYGDQKAL